MWATMVSIVVNERMLIAVFAALAAACSAG